MKITRKVINFNKLNQIGGAGFIRSPKMQPVVRSFGRRIDSKIETVDWSKEDYMSKDTPVGTLFTTGGVPGFVFRIIKIVDGPVETETETVNNKDGTIKNIVKAIKTVDRICTAAISLRDGNSNVRCFFPQSLINSDYLNRHRKLGRFSFGINGKNLATKINIGQQLKSDERAWQMIYNSKMINSDNKRSSIKNIQEYHNYVNTLNQVQKIKAKEEAQGYYGMINAIHSDGYRFDVNGRKVKVTSKYGDIGFTEKEIEDAIKKMEKAPPR